MTTEVLDGDLTTKEQTHVRAALQFLRVRCGGWAPLAKVLRVKETSLASVAGGHKTVTARLVFRTSRFTKVGVDDLLAGKFPEPGTCPMCGHRKDEAP